LYSAAHLPLAQRSFSPRQPCLQLAHASAQLRRQASSEHFTLHWVHAEAQRSLQVLQAFSQRGLH
jgi:hypothetical protein